MNILILTENYPPETNAAATRISERAAYWRAWGHEVTVITTAPNFPSGRVFEGYDNHWRFEEDMDGVRVIRVKSFIAANKGTGLRLLDFLSFMLTGFFAALKAPRPDVLVANSPQFFTAVAGWAAAKVKKVPFVFELADIWPASIVAVGAMKPSLALSLIERVELFLYRQSDVVVALTKAFKANLTGRGIDGDKIAVVPNGVDLSRYQPRPRDGDMAAEWGLEDKFVIGYIGTHGMAMGLANVLDAAERLQDVADLRFILVGDGAEREALIKDATKRKLDNVLFIPPQPKDRMPVVWSLCDVALVHLRNSPVFAEVIPSKMFEAMGMGLPILLALPEGESSAILADDQAGLHVPAEDPAALAEAACALHDDPALMDSLKANALKAAPTHTRQRQAEQFIQALEIACGKDGKAGDV